MVKSRTKRLMAMATGWGVVVLQEALRACFGQNISVNGQFGPNTKNALKNAQRWIHQYTSEIGMNASIAVDGEYGPQTASWWWDARYYRTGGVPAASRPVAVTTASSDRRRRPIRPST